MSAWGRDASRDSEPVEVLDMLRLAGIRWRHVGREVVIECPMHDDTHPSLRVRPDTGEWYCHPCGVGGGVVALDRLLGGGLYAGGSRVARRERVARGAWAR